MDISKLLNNFFDSFKKTSTIKDAIKRILWLYKIGKDTVINFKFKKPNNAVKLYVRNNKGADAFIISEVFEQGQYDFDLGFHPQVIVDLGANAGFSSIFFKNKFPHSKIICVEPMPGNILSLKKNLELNSISNIVLYECAISVTSGSIFMLESEIDYGHKVAGMEFGNSKDGSRFSVPAITMEEVFCKEKIDNIDILKIDIEGYEGILLNQNCEWLKKVNSIILEIHEGFTIKNLTDLSNKYHFSLPEYHNGLWILKAEHA